jgi:predicted nucleotidyltransferase
MKQILCGVIGLGNDSYCALVLLNIQNKILEKIKEAVMLRVEHDNFIKNSLNTFKSDSRFVGVAAAGSYITKEMDEYSDIDLVIAVKPESFDEIMSERFKIAEKLGHLLSAFTGEHVREPRLLICLYSDPLLHVDLKFISLEDMAHRVEEFEILWQRNGLLTEKFKEKEAKFPKPSLQWIEDRFWVWIHYGTTKLGRGEVFETLELISFLRKTVIGPLLLMHKGRQPRGVRKIEVDAPEYLDRLIKTVAFHDKRSCYEAINATAGLYRELREIHKFKGFVFRAEAETLAMEYLESIYLKENNAK